LNTHNDNTRLDKRFGRELFIVFFGTLFLQKIEKIEKYILENKIRLKYLRIFKTVNRKNSENGK